MVVRIGTMFFGKVDAIGSESVQTKFLVVGLPLLPLSSHYVLEQHGNGIRGFEIPTSAKSVLFGYLRIYAWLAALLLGVFAYVDRHSDELWAWCVLFAVVATVATFGLGGLSKREELRRSLLRQNTGVGAPPEILPSDTRATLADTLMKAWNGANGGKPWRAAVEAGAADSMLFAIAEYHGEPELARAILERMPASEKPIG